MKIQNRLSLLWFPIIIILLAGSVEVCKSEPTAGVQQKLSTQEAMNAVKESLKDIYRDWYNITYVKFAEDNITVYFTYHDGNKYEFYCSYNNIKDLQVQIVRFTMPQVKSDNNQNLIFNEKSSAMKFVSAFNSLKHTSPQERQRKRDDCLRVIRTTSVDLILSGATGDELTIPCEIKREGVETILNEILVDWKNKGLREQLQKSSSSQLSDLGSKLEKAILNLDFKAGKLKDAADAEPRQVNPAAQKAPDALAAARLLEQRKTILMAILGSVRQGADAAAAAAKEVKEPDAEQVSETAAKPVPKAKSAPRRRQPDAGASPPPELPAGGALSGN